MFNCCRVLLVSALLVTLPSLALADAISAPLDPPPALSPAGRAWWQSYQALDAPGFAACMAKLRAHPASILCLHNTPALREDNQPYWMKGKVPPLSTLSHTEALTLAHYFVGQQAKLASYLAGWDQVRLFAQTGNEIAPASSQPGAQYEAPSVFWRLARPILFLVAVTVGLGWLRSRPARTAASSGYRPPVQWKYRSKASEEMHKANASLKQNGGHVPDAKPFDLLNADLFRERAAMPPCLVWYRPAELDEVTGKPEGLWVSVMDGNQARKQPGAPMATYMQTLEVKGVAAFISRQRLRLWSVDPDVIANLNRGPLRQEIVRATAYPSGKTVMFSLPMGAEGAPLPQAPRLPDSRTTHGSGREETGDADAESR